MRMFHVVVQGRLVNRPFTHPIVQIGQEGNQTRIWDGTNEDGWLVNQPFDEVCKILREDPIAGEPGWTGFYGAGGTRPIDRNG